MKRRRLEISPRELVLLHRCLSSKICIRIFRVLHENGVLNISSVSRRARCNNKDALKHLRNLEKLGIVHEEFYAGRHTFTLKKNDLSEFLKRAVEIEQACMERSRPRPTS